jgi:hypothetical protein
MTVTGPFGIKINCSYSKASMSGTARTETETILDGAAIFGEQEFKKSEGGGECPESGKLDMTFTMETDVVVATPIYISP